jgi:AraC-like DNA-binding protein
VLPDGCIDILLDLLPVSGGPSAGGALVVGTMTRAISVATDGPTRITGVRFRPGGASPFVPAPAHELTDQSVPLDTLWGREAARFHERLILAKGDSERVGILDRALAGMLERANDRLDGTVLAASRSVAASGGRATVDTIARSSGIGRRQLERRYRASVGIGPKLSCSIARFRKVVALLHREPSAPLGQVAFRAGYADQSHLNRDFKRFAGLSPGAYRRSWEPAALPRDAFVQDGGGLPS